jgi:superoxide dismutase, Fe-Mn family
MNNKKGKRRFIISEQGARGTPPPAGHLPAPSRRRPVPVEKPEGDVMRESHTDRFAARDFIGLLGLPGFSDAMLNNHFELYQGYVKNANALLGDLEQMRKDRRLEGAPAAEVRRRFGWEFDSIRLHEFYFENLTRTPKPLDPASRLSTRMTEDFGGFDNWKSDFEAAASMRGTGWVVTYHDPLRNRLFNAWIEQHHSGHLVACSPVVVFDAFEHAYMLDYGIKKAGYIEAFFKALNYDACTARLP